MNRSISKIFEEDQELSSQAKNPSEYSMLKHDMNEIPNIPIDPNLLFFQDKVLQMRYFKLLYFDFTTGSLSKEFSYNLMNFYIYITILLVIILGCVVSLYTNNRLPCLHLIFHLSCSGFIFLYAYTILLCILKWRIVLFYNRAFLIVLGWIFYLYMIIGAPQILSALTGGPQNVSLLPMSIGITGFTYSYRRVLFDSYRYLIVTVVPVLILFLAFNLIYSEVFTYSILGEFAAVALFLLTQVIETHTVENRTMQLFYRMEREQEMNCDEDLRGSVIFEEKNYNSMTEAIIRKCDFIIKEIKYAISVIIFKDVKNRLKIAQNEMMTIKSKVGKLDYAEKFDLSSQDLDEQDKEFISQNYLHINSSLARPNADIKKLKTEPKNSLCSMVHKTVMVDLSEKLERIGKEWNFNTFYIHDKTGRSISVVAIHIFATCALEQFLKISEEVFFSYFESIEKNYKQNPYHNTLHGADVFLSSYYFVMNSDIFKYMTKLDTISLLTAGMGHDVGHPGLTNRYLVQSRDKIAILYNDQSVLENMHCSLIFSLMTSEYSDIFSELKEEDWTNSRKMIVSMVLETDLSRHFEIFNKFRTRALALNDLTSERYDDKILVLSMALKCADIGHSAKSRELHLKWSSLVMEEFFNQGDREKALGLPVSMYCDRNNTDIPKSQTGFIKNICTPMFECWANYLKSSQIDLCLNQLRENFGYWNENYRGKRITNIQRLKEDSIL